MRHLCLFPLVSCAVFLPLAYADDDSKVFDPDFQITLETMRLDGRSLGNEPDEDRLESHSLELEIDVEYAINDQWSLFLRAAAFDEREQLEPAGLTIDSSSGVERKEMGIAYAFGEEIESTLEFGRLEFESNGDAWLWWEDELDAIRLSTEFDEVETMFALARELGRSNSDEDFIDPELEDVHRLLFNLSWSITENQSLTVYYLDQSDRSKGYTIGQQVSSVRSDEADSDLSWKGLSYLGEFDHQRYGELDIELHAAWVSGKETLYEFDDPVASNEEVTEREDSRVDGDGRGLHARWRPAQFEQWSFVIGKSYASGDSNPDDSIDRSFRGTGIQQDYEIFGYVFQPDLSNLEIGLIGVEWNPAETISVALYRFDYRQRVAADEIRETAIEADPDATNRHLGDEIDLILTFQPQPDLEISVTAAEFDPGNAFSGASGRSASYLNLELVYEF